MEEEPKREVNYEVRGGLYEQEYAVNVRSHAETQGEHENLDKPTLETLVKSTWSKTKSWIEPE